MSQVKDGDRIKVHYTAKTEDGNVFETTENRPPLDFTVGDGQVMPAIEKGVAGMNLGETKTITLQPEEAFGPRHEELVIEVEKEVFPPDIMPEIGLKLQIKQPEGEPMVVMITDLDENNITLDANHPLAGSRVILDIELVEIV
jgi:peptidylprolyl isomerase